MIEPEVCERAAAHGLTEAVVIDLRDGPWRGPLDALIAELIRRSRARPAGGMRVHVAPVRTLDEAAELIDQLGVRLPAGETMVALCAEIDVDLIEHHAGIYSSLPAH